MNLDKKVTLKSLTSAQTEGLASVQFEVTPYLFQTERYTESL